MKKVILVILMLFTLASIGFVCADNSSDDVETGHMYIRTNGEFNPKDVDSNKTYTSNSATEYLPITNSGGSYKGSLNQVSVNVSALKKDGEEHGDVWSHIVDKNGNDISKGSSTGEVNLNKYFNISDEFANYLNELGNKGIGYNENVSNTILKTWYPDIWENVNNLHINTTKDGYNFFAYVIKKQSDGIHIDGVLVSAFVFKVVEIKNDVNGENPDADIGEILKKLDDDISNYYDEPENLTATNTTEDTIEDDLNNDTTENTTGFDPLGEENVDTVLENSSDDDVSEETNEPEVSDSNEPKIVTDSHATGNPILLIIIVIGLLAGAYVKR